MLDSIVLEQIKTCEEKLIQAFLVNDLLVFDELLHDDLLFNLPNGQTITKAVTESHRAVNLIMSTMIAREQVISLIDDHAILRVTIKMNGSYLNQAINGKFRYQRIWKSLDNTWKIIAGSCIELKG